MLDDLPLHPNAPEVPEHNYVFNYKPGDIDLAVELAEQYGKAKSLYANIETDPSVPANQKAQVLNSLTSILSQITKSEGEVHNLNSIKKLENALIAALKISPKPLQDDFYAAYEAELNGQPS